MSLIAERPAPAAERVLGTANYKAVASLVGTDEAQMSLDPDQVSAESLTPLFEPAFGSTSIMSAVTIGTMRLSRESVSEGISAYAREMGEKLTRIADALEAEAALLPTVRWAGKSRSFIELLKAGSGATVLALERLSGDYRPLWLYFLQYTTGVRPAAGEETVEGATKAWLAWGHRMGLL